MRYLLLWIAVLCWSCSWGQDKQAVVRKDIEKLFDSQPGTFALAFRDLQTGEEILINPDTIFHAASTMKTPVMIEAFKQAEEGRFDLTDSLVVKNRFYSIVDSSTYSLTPESDSETKLYDLVGQKRSIYDLVYDMIIMSSNLATNIVIDLVDARSVTETMVEIGAEDMLVLRGVEDLKAYRAGLSNRSSARSLMVIYEKLARGALVNEAACQDMIEILFDQHFNDIIPALLPKKVRVAHKTGSITGVHHDSGIVFLPDGRQYVLVIMSKNLDDFDLATEMMARVSKRVYRYVKQ